MDKKVGELTIIKEVFFDRFKKFFKKIFLKKANISTEQETVNKNDFFSRIKIEENNEEKRLLKLQNLMAEEVITEDELPEDDVKALHELYDSQILQLKKEIDEYRQKILKLRMNINEQKRND